MTDIRDHNSAQRGFVLIAVLSVMALLSGAVVAMLLLSRTAIDSADIANSKLRSDAMLQSALAMAGFQLFSLKLPIDKVDNQQIRLDQGTVTLKVTTDASKVDLNGSSAKLLAAAYQASGLKSLTPQSFAARVIDWRDVDNDPTEDGAEGGDYLAAHLAYEPRNGPFRSVDDLRWVLGISAPDIVALRNYVTIFNPRGRLDAFSASPTLISFLPGVSPEMVKDGLFERIARSASAIRDLDDTFLVQSSMIDTAMPQTYRVRISVKPTNGRAIEVEVVLCAGVFPSDPYEILNWNDHPPAGD